MRPELDGLAIDDALALGVREERALGVDQEDLEAAGARRQLEQAVEGDHPDHRQRVFGVGDRRDHRHRQGREGLGAARVAEPDVLLLHLVEGNAVEHRLLVEIPELQGSSRVGGGNLSFAGVQRDRHQLREVVEEAAQERLAVLLRQVLAVHDAGVGLQPLAIARQQDFSFLGGALGQHRAEIVDVGALVRVEQVGHGVGDHADHRGDDEQHRHQHLQPDRKAQPNEHGDPLLSSVLRVQCLRGVAGVSRLVPGFDHDDVQAAIERHPVGKLAVLADLDILVGHQDPGSGLGASANLDPIGVDGAVDQIDLERRRDVVLDQSDRA